MVKTGIQPGWRWISQQTACMHICVAFKEGRETWSLEWLELLKPLRGLLPLRFPGDSLEDT